MAFSRRVRMLATVLAGGLVGVACSHVWLPFGYVVNFPGFGGAPLADDEVARLRVPEGFVVTAFASGIPGARMMRVTSAGDLLVSAPRDGRVVLVERDRDGDGRADGSRVLLEGLDLPHGLALHGEWLYVAETGAVRRVRFDPARRETRGPLERVVDGLPREGRHWTRTIGIGPDERLYVSVGSSCNVCIEDDPRRAAITSFALDGSDARVHATGLRNAVGFAWHPRTHALWATDNNRDLLGDDFPPGELDEIVEGGFYGWPFANGDRVPDPEFDVGHEREVAASIPPAHGFAAHTAPLGIVFHQGGRFPERYRDVAFVALHGSWNRSAKIGYEVVAVSFPEGKPPREEPFLTGFLEDDEVMGRPVDVAVGVDGALYVSDDYTGQIYRVAYGETPRSFDGGPRPTPNATDPLAGIGPDELEHARRTGARIWHEGGCGSCHGADRSEGQRPLSRLRERYTIESLVRFLAAPQPPMPLFPLAEDARRALAIDLLDRFP